MNTPVSRVWHKKDDRWWVPRAGSFFLLRSPLIDSTALAAVQSRLFTDLIRDALQEYAYDAELAGLSYTFNQAGDGILLSAEGYNDKLPVLVDVIVKGMKDYKVDEQRFAMMLDQVPPYLHVGTDCGHLLQELSFTIEHKLAVLDQVTPQNLQEYIGRLHGRPTRAIPDSPARESLLLDDPRAVPA
ncbi:hypothetical protein JCM10213_004127 [Rhodosporidiobolus nylandii]